MDLQAIVIEKWRRLDVVEPDLVHLPAICGTGQRRSAAPRSKFLGEASLPGRISRKLEDE